MDNIWASAQKVSQWQPNWTYTYYNGIFSYSGSMEHTFPEQYIHYLNLIAIGLMEHGTLFGIILW